MNKRTATTGGTNNGTLPGFDSGGGSGGSEKLSGVVHRVVYANADKGFSVLTCIDGRNRQFRVVGFGDPVVPGDSVEAEGNWEIDPKYGRRFAARRIKGRIPESTDGIERYLLSKHVHGVGKKTVERLVAHFGARLPEYMDNETMLLAAGISERHAHDIAQHWRRRGRHGQLLSVLFAHDIGERTAQSIIRRYGDNADHVVRKQPYRLVDDVAGIGFAKADRIALSQSLDRHSGERVNAALSHTLKEGAGQGHTFMREPELLQQTADLTQLGERRIRQQLEKQLEKGFVVREFLGGLDAVADRRVRDCEAENAERLQRHLGPVEVDGTTLEATIAAAEKAIDIELNEGQRHAVRTALSNRTAIITGGPGTGKTTTLKTILHCLDRLGRVDADGRHGRHHIALAAPTGRAAQRMAESTGRQASTLHRLLEWGKGEETDGGGGRLGFARNGDNPLEASFLAIDEASMIDVWLMRDILRALPDDTRLVLIGDADQLPSVGAGNVLADLIASGGVPTARLTEVRRQGEGSAIAAAAAQINQAFEPTVTPPETPQSDMWGWYLEDADDIVAAVLRYATEMVPAHGLDPVRDLQILAPGHRGRTGVANLNRVLQEKLNPEDPFKPQLPHGDRVFRLGDRVIQTANSYEQEVFNGDIGFVSAISGNGKERIVHVEMAGREVPYRASDLNDLQLAYAITIHKSQGSEFPAVGVAMTFEHYIMLRRNLLYTAITRARSLCCLLGTQKAVRMAVRQDGARRLTSLGERLAGLIFAQRFAA